MGLMDGLNPTMRPFKPTKPSKVFVMDSTTIVMATPMKKRFSRCLTYKLVSALVHSKIVAQMVPLNLSMRPSVIMKQTKYPAMVSTTIAMAPSMRTSLRPSLTNKKEYVQKVFESVRASKVGLSRRTAKSNITKPPRRSVMGSTMIATAWKMKRSRSNSPIFRSAFVVAHSKYAQVPTVKLSQIILKSLTTSLSRTSAMD